MPTASDVFISYCATDREFAEAVYDCLRASGFDVWFDKVRLQPGFDWYREIESACEASLAVVPILTPRWKQSWWTCYETYAHDTVIPVVFEGALHEVATAPLRRYQAHHVDFDQLTAHDWAPLVEAVRSAIRAAGSAPIRLARLATLRHPRNKYFIGREIQMNALMEQLFGGITRAISQASMRETGSFSLSRQHDLHAAKDSGAGHPAHSSSRNAWRYSGMTVPSGAMIMNQCCHGICSS